MLCLAENNGVTETPTELPANVITLSGQALSD